jgi:hypothetical protein
MSIKRPELGFHVELIDINKEFLNLATDPRVSGFSSVLGVPAPLLTRLRALTPNHLDAVAATPLLLAEFVPLPGVSSNDSVAEASPLPLGLPPGWLREADGFANRLLTCIWQATRQDRLLTAFCIGIDASQHRKLADLSFRRISENSGKALQCLHLRLSDHVPFWHDLVESTQQGSADKLTACRLAMIPLTLAGPDFPTSTSNCPRYF